VGGCEGHILYRELIHLPEGGPWLIV